MVDVKVDTEELEKKPESFFSQFDAVSSRGGQGAFSA